MNALDEPETHSTVVAFPGLHLLSEADVERINVYDSYNLGSALAGLSAVLAKGDDIPATVGIYHLWRARVSMEDLLKKSPIPLGVSKASAENLLNSVVQMFHEHYPEGKWPDQDTPSIPAWKASILKQAIEKFETVFGEEVGGLDFFRKQCQLSR